MGDFDERLTHMRKPGEWGGEPELLTASRVVQRRIFVWANGACLAPYGESDHPAIHLSYENNVHYNLFIVDPRSVSQNQATVSDGEHCVVHRVGEVTSGAVKCNMKGQPVREAPSGAGKCSANEHNVLEAPSVADKCTVSKARGGRPKKKGFRQPSKRRTGVDIDVPEATEAAQQNDDEFVMHTAAAISGHVDHPQISASESGSVADAVALPDDGNNSKYVNDNTSKAPEPETTNATDADVKARGRSRKRNEFKQSAKRQNCEENDVPEATSTAKQNDVQPVMDTECDAATNFESCCVDNPQMHPAPFDSTADTAVAHGDGNVSVPPSAGLPVSNRTDGCGIAILTRTTLDGYAANSPDSIVIESVETDMCSSSERGLDGPWSYRNSRNVLITYAVGDSGEKRRIRLDNLRLHGFCAPSRAGQLRYNMYSWLRFKEVVRKSEHSVSTVLGDEGLFLDTLCQVDRYYCRNRRCADQEGLQSHRGPQTWEDRHNLLQLHYYGKGRLRYFRLTTLRELFSSRYGADLFAEFRADPWTDTLTEEHFEQLLIDVHIELRDKHYRYLHSHVRALRRASMSRGSWHRRSHGVQRAVCDSRGRARSGNASQ